jgi:hypothetical protein
MADQLLHRPAVERLMVRLIGFFLLAQTSEAVVAQDELRLDCEAVGLCK